MGWMAPLRHLSAKLLVFESVATGSHPWVRLGHDCSDLCAASPKISCQAGAIHT